MSTQMAEIKLVIEEWWKLGIELLTHYECHRCKEATCCHIACQLQEKEFRDMAIAKHMTFQAFFDTYCQQAPLGTYLKTPCPFLEQRKKGATCTMHYVRPFMCRLYPFSSYPGIVLNIDICPLAKDIADDVRRIIAELQSGKTPPTDSHREAARAAKEETEGMLNMLDTMAPESDVKGELHESIKAHGNIFKLLLEEKQNSGKTYKRSS